MISISCIAVKKKEKLKTFTELYHLKQLHPMEARAGLVVHFLKKCCNLPDSTFIKKLNQVI